jgi:hypothetical protein
LPKGDIPELTPVKNFANIVFDFNQPVITNETLNTLVTEICSDVTVLIDTLICAGGHFLGLTEPGVYYDTTSIGIICDSFTVIHLDVLGPVIIQLDTLICEGESYNGFDSTGVFIFDSINPVTGCTDLVVLNLVVIPLGMGPCITSISRIDGFYLHAYPNPAQNEIFIEMPLPIESVRLISIHGRDVPIRNWALEENRVVLQLIEGTPNGFFLLVVKMEGRAYFKKMMIFN